MKYVLRRGLPFAKIGTKVIINYADGVVIKCDTFIANKKGENVTEAKRIYLGDKTDLLNEGWIEEEKPREFYIPVDRDTGKLLASDKPMDKGYSGGWTLAVEVIKVREVEKERI